MIEYSADFVPPAIQTRREDRPPGLPDDLAKLIATDQDYLTDAELALLDSEMARIRKAFVVLKIESKRNGQPRDTPSPRTARVGPLSRRRGHSVEGR